MPLAISGQGPSTPPIRRPLSATAVDLDKLPVDIPAILPLSNPVPQLVGNNPVRLVGPTAQPDQIVHLPLVIAPVDDMAPGTVAASTVSGKTTETPGD